MKKEYDLSKMKSRQNPYATKLKNQPKEKSTSPGERPHSRVK
jgi:hypothetical protein